MEFTYYNPVKLFHGATKIGEVAEEVKSFGDKVLLITGGESFHKNGYFDKLKTELEEKKYRYMKSAETENHSFPLFVRAWSW